MDFLLSFIMNEKFTGILVDIDGMDGAGKSTQVDMLGQYYTGMGIPHYITKEPSEGEFGLLLRQKLKDPTTDPVIDALLFAADRVDHCNREIRPHLQAGELVITDRYLLSSLAYQCVQMRINDPSRGSSDASRLQWIWDINQFHIEPNVIFYIEIQPETAIERIAAARNIEDAEKFEKLDFQRKLRDKFIYLANNLMRPHIIRIDGEQPADCVYTQIINELNNILVKLGIKAARGDQ